MKNKKLIELDLGEILSPSASKLCKVNVCSILELVVESEIYMNIHLISTYLW